MDTKRDENRLPASGTGTSLAAMLLAAVSAIGCGARRGRVVAWRPAGIVAEAGEPGVRDARRYRVALPPAQAGERPMRAELVFASSLDGAHVDAIGVGQRARRPLLARKPASGEVVVVPLAGEPVDQVEV